MEGVEESCSSVPDVRYALPQVMGGVGRENLLTSAKDGCLGTGSEEHEGFLISKAAGILLIENCGVVERVPEQVDEASVPPCHVDKGALYEDVKEAEEDNGRSVAAERESYSIVLEEKLPAEAQSMVWKEDCRSIHVSFDVIEQIDTSCSPNGSTIYCSDAAANVNGLLIEEGNKVEKECTGYVLTEKQSSCPPLEEEPSIKAQSLLNSGKCNAQCMVVENNHLVDTHCETTELGKRNLSPPCEDVTVISDSGNGSVILVGQRKEVEVGFDRLLVAPVEETTSLVLQDKPPVEVLEKDNAECCYEYSSLLPSRTLEVALANSSDSKDQPSEDKGENGCESTLISSAVGGRFPLLKIGMDSIVQADASCSPLSKKCVDVALNSRSGSMDKDCAYSLPDDEKVETSLEVGCHNSCLESGSKDSLSFEKKASSSPTEGSCSQQSLHLSAAFSDGSSDSSNAACFQENDSNNIHGASASIANMKDCSEMKSDGVAFNKKPVLLNVFRRTNPRRAASSRTSHANGKSDQLTRTKNAARKCKKEVNISLPLLSSKMISSKVKGKRSSFHRLARHSVWGGDANLISVFRQADELIKYHDCLTEVQNKKSRSVGANVKQKTRKCRSSRMSRTRCSFTANSMHLKDQIYLDPTFPVADSRGTEKATFPNLGVSNEGNEADHNFSEVYGSAVGVNLLQRDGQQGDKDLESTLTQDMSVDNMLGELPFVSSHVESETLVENNNQGHLLDPGSSPDSDVYNPVVDIGVISTEAANNRIQDSEESQNVFPLEIGTGKNLSAHLLSSSKASMSPESASSLDLQPQYQNKKGNKEKKDNKASRLEHDLQEPDLVKFNPSDSENLDKDFKSLKSSCKVKASVNAVSAEPAVVGTAEQERFEDSSKVEVELENWAILGKDNGESKESLLAVKPEGCNNVRSNRKGVSRGRLRSTVSASCRKQDGHVQNVQKKEKMQKTGKGKRKDKSQKLDTGVEASETMKLSKEAKQSQLAKSSDLICKEWVLAEASCGLEGQSLQPRRAWVLCDECNKWRAISAALADIIDETNCRWVCKDNIDSAFADCSIPQEKTNAEINVELDLDISDASCDEDSCTRLPNSKGAVSSKLTGSEPISWTLIKTNLYMHRNRRNQAIDEIMVCHCKRPSDGSLGCGDACLNRILNIECVKGTCPCGDLCSNQQFQRRKHAKFQWLRCGKKGFGLELLEDVSCGQFLIEYVGEVLDSATYEARQKSYALRGQKHFYFMTLYGGEVIDACAKGNLGRFINHSCSPNCRTEKWMVNGEVCIGLFAIRDIKKGEEVTFDYNYERVVGAAAKKCFCGSSACKGYIGGDPLNAEVIVQGDSDDENPEPLMINEVDEKLNQDVKDLADHAKPVKDKQASFPGNNLLLQCSHSLSETEVCQQSKDTICRAASDVSPSVYSFQNLDLREKEEIACDTIPDVHQSDSSSRSLDDRKAKDKISKLVSDIGQRQASIAESNPGKISISDSGVNMSLASNVDGRQKISKPFFAKSSRSIGISNKCKIPTKSLVSQKEKKVSVSTDNNLRGVEKELDELLDADGGISKRKDATKGYLKLLFLTAAEGDKIGVASQSIRDLSLILDALLKTKSRTVLVDIINKNGLQMLHNIMKQNRTKFNRIPIIRKLLKVLEFLALKAILTPEHMNKSPSCSGVESFRDSILKLTRHNDVQVHQIARSFRDKWIPRMVKPLEPADRDDIQLESQRSHCSRFQSSRFGCQLDQGSRHSDAIVCVSEAVHQSPSSLLVKEPQETSHPSQLVSSSLSLGDNNLVSGTKKRKCKSRWDQPFETTDSRTQTLSNKDHEEIVSQSKFLKQNFEAQKERTSSLYEVESKKNTMHKNIDDEEPPGFGSSQKDTHPAVPSECMTPNMAVGHPQERYISQLSVSYGMPVTLVQQLGDFKVDGDKALPDWSIAPSMPFHPFPPLPSYPRGNPNHSTQVQEYSKHGIGAQGMNKRQLNKRCHAESRATDLSPSSSREMTADVVRTWYTNSHNANTPFNSSCRRLFQPHRLNNQRFQRRVSPWSQKDNCEFRSSLRRRNTDVGVENERVYWPPWPREDKSCGSRGNNEKGD